MDPLLDVVLVLRVELAGQFGQDRSGRGGSISLPSSGRLDQLLVESEGNDNRLRLAVGTKYDGFRRRSLSAKPFEHPRQLDASLGDRANSASE